MPPETSHGESDFGATPSGLRDLAVIADRYWNWNAGRIYVSRLVEAILLVPDRPRVTVLIKESNAGVGDLPPADRVLTYDAIGRVGELVQKVQRRFEAGYVLPRAELKKLRPDAMFSHALSTSVAGSTTLAHFLDYQQRFYPELDTSASTADRKAKEERAARLSDAIFFNSRVALDEFMADHPEAQAVTGVNPLYSMIKPQDLAHDPAEVAESLGVPERFFIVPSQLWAHKNHMQLLEALRILKDRDQIPTAVLTGLPYDHRSPRYASQILQTISGWGLRSRVVVLGELGWLDLCALMRGATAFVQPSLYEGGGLPAEEARALGKPIVLADLPRQREADIPGATYFQPGSPESLAEAIVAATEDRAGGVDQDAEARAISSSVQRARKIGEEFLRVADQAFVRRGALSPERLG